MEEYQEHIEEKFLCFRQDKEYFIIPLFEVVRIVLHLKNEANADSFFSYESFPELYIIDMCSHKNKGTNEYPCAIVVGEEKEQFGIGVDGIEGIIQINPKNQFDLPDLVKDNANKYLDGVSYWEEERRLCFLVNCRRLREYTGQEF